MKAKTAENAILYGESGQDLVEFAALTDFGDRQNFTSGSSFWSDASGKVPDIKPNGLATGGAGGIAASLSNDVVDVAALTGYLAGVLTTVAADVDTSIPRGDSSYLLITLAADGYTDVVVGDIGKDVTGDVTGDTGALVAYNNTTREWLIDPTEETDTFDDDDEALTIATGTGAGTQSGVAVAAPYKISIVTVTSAGAIAVVEGDEGTSFSATYDVPGGIPYIPTTSFALFQVRYTSSTAAVVAATEIKQVIGSHCERYDYPLWEVDYENGEIDFLSVLPAAHTGGVSKAVYAEFYTAAFAEIPNASDYVPAENSHSVNSEQVYGSTVGTTSTSLGAGSFKALLQNGINDTVLLMKDDTRWLKFYPDRLVTTKYNVSQGKIGIKRSYPPGGSMVADVTIAASSESGDIYS